jgi:hypothetical protein
VKALLVVCIISVACGKSSSKPPPDKQAAAAKQVRPRTYGVQGLPSLAREHWPCRAEGTLPAMNARTIRTYDYADAPASCVHSPDYWLPGCPRRIEMRNADLGVASETSLEYDAQGRVAMVQSGRLPGAKLQWSADGKLIAEGDNRFFGLDARTIVIEFDDQTETGRAELDDARRPLRVLGMYENETRRPQSVETFTYDGPRLATYRVEEWGELKVDLRFVYDCK